jgi:multicomponent Na+:H+ antiporter subunit F
MSDMSEMSSLVHGGVQLALTVMVLLLVAISYRMLRGGTPADRLQAIDTATTLLVGIVVLVSVVLGTPMPMDVGIALAALGFVATLAIARYLSEGRVF